MLDFPCVIDTELIGEFNLIQRLLKQPEFIAFVPGPRKLMFVENAEFHGPSRRDTLLAKLSSLAGRVASAFLAKRINASGARPA